MYLSVQWSAIFPTEQVTEQQSALFVKKLLAVAVGPELITVPHAVRYPITLSIVRLLQLYP